jgi:hypothetical protein
VTVLLERRIGGEWCAKYGRDESNKSKVAGKSKVVVARRMALMVACSPTLALKLGIEGCARGYLRIGESFALAMWAPGEDVAGSLASGVIGE